MKVPNHVNEAEIHEDVCHGLAPWYTYGLKVNIKVANYNGFKSLEEVKGLLKV